MLLGTLPDEKLISQLFGNQPDSVVWFLPVFDNAEEKDANVVDFLVRYCNAAAAKILGARESEIAGQTLKTSGLLDRESAELIYEQCLSVWTTGESVEFTYYSPGFDKHFNVQRSKVMNGILSITRDRTLEVKADKEREQQGLLLRKVLNNSPVHIVLFHAIRDSRRRITDFEMPLVNDKFAQDAGRSREEIQSMKLSQLHDHDKLSGLLIQVADSGEPIQTEIHLDLFSGWFRLNADRLEDDRVIATFLNINDSKFSAEQLARQSEWFNSILNNSSNGVVVASAVRDKNGNIEDFELILANPAGKQMSGLPDDAPGKTICEVWPQLKGSELLRQHKQVVETGVPYTSQVPYATDGHSGYLQLSLSKFGDGLISNFIDITEIVEQEKIIRDQAQLLTLILNSSVNGVYAIEAVRDSDGKVTDFIITHVNDLFCRMSQRTRENLVGKSYLKTFPDVRSAGVFERNCRILETGEPVREERHYQGDGVDSWYDTSIIKVSDDKLVISFNDVTALKKTAMDLEVTNKELTKSNDKLSEFTQIASHDLNEPLRKIMTYSSLLGEQATAKSDSDTQSYIRKISATANRMRALIDDLLTWSSLNAGIGTLETVSLNAVIQEVQTDLESVISEKNARMLVTALPDIRGDKTHLRQIFQNLISNSIKFQKDDDVPYIEVRNEPAATKQGRAFHCISIKDNGIGFDEQNADKIFEVFHRLHPRSRYEGTGIGLAIVQKAMENHRGAIEVKSHPGKGTTFFLYFPKE